MSAVATTAVAPAGRSAPQFVHRGRLAQAAADGLTVTWRNLIGYVRIPEAMFFSSVQPIMFVLLFRYVFGGAIPVKGFHYVDYLMPGIYVQTVAFGSMGTAIGMADDLGKGLIERFRSLPMARSSVLVGRTVADLCRNVFVIGLITAVGYAVGFRVHTGVVPFLAAAAMLLLFSYALAWGFAAVGLNAPNGETAQLMAFPILFPLTFASSAFVPIQSMPSLLQGFARNQPFTQVINAARLLFNGGATTTTVLHAVLWSIALLVVLAPIAVRGYRRAA
jgi:ABC transporter DrrB family efflux protein